MSGKARLNTVPFSSDEIFNKYDLDTVQHALRSSGFSRVSHKTVLRNGMETYYIRADRCSVPESPR
jgi:hypothetical protein